MAHPVIRTIWNPDKIVHDYFRTCDRIRDVVADDIDALEDVLRTPINRICRPRPDAPNPGEKTPMRIVALEEHYTVPRIVAGISPDAIARRGFPGPDFVWAQTTKRNELADLGRARLADMDASGITVQVLSVAGPAPTSCRASRASLWHATITTRWPRPAPAIPTRFRGFAHLPMLSPEAAADELERTVKDLGFHGALVNGATDGRFLDDPAFEPILARAAALDVPIYLHPGIPRRQYANAYYDGLPGNFSFTMALSAWGWHADTAIHVLRLVLSGALDRHPRLKIVIGHMGEAIPFMLDRIDETTATDGEIASSGARCGKRSSIRSGSRPAGSSPWRRSWRR